RADRREREHADPEDRRERVVQQAVRDERVPARIPEVVPDGEAVVEQERPLVCVGGPVDARRGPPEEKGCKRGGERGRDRRLARDQLAVGKAHRPLEYEISQLPGATIWRSRAESPP